jgi:hypothetical protein
MRRFAAAGVMVVALLGCPPPHVQQDAGPPMDSGAPFDAGPPIDAGDLDAGVDAGVDAGAPFDAGSFDPLDGAKSGTRLKLRWADFNGTRQIFQVYDTALGANCLPWSATDGRVYCIPGSTEVVFTDATCTTPIGAFAAPCGTHFSAPAFYGVYTATECDPAIGISRLDALYARGAVVSAPASVFTNHSGLTPCGPATLDPSSQFFSLLPVPLAAMVELTPQHRAGSGRFGQNLFVSSEGLALPTTISDPDFGACRPVSTNGTTSTSCLPTLVANEFAESTCSTPATRVNAQCPSPSFAAVYDPTCAVETWHAVRVGPSVAPTSVFEVAYMCQAWTSPASGDWYATTGPATVGTLGRRADTTGHDLEVMHLYEGDSRFRDGTLYDTAHRVECRITGVGDGTFGCLPNVASPVLYYTDPGCQTPILVFDRDPNPAGCNDAPVPTFTTSSVAIDQCSSLAELRPVLGPYPGTLYDHRSARCAVTTRTATHYELGAAMPSSAVPIATIVQDP